MTFIVQIKTDKLLFETLTHCREVVVDNKEYRYITVYKDNNEILVIFEDDLPNISVEDKLTYYEASWDFGRYRYQEMNIDIEFFKKIIPYQDLKIY